MLSVLFFFFSSRRRHTRSLRDWSSDVCSSDLVHYQRTDLVNQVLHTVEKNLSEGALLVVAVLFAFLGNIRAGLIVASAIPLSMLFAVTIMEKVGIAGSLMSLGAINF